QEGGAFEPDLDERGLHPRHHPLHLALVDVADHAATPAALDVQLLQHAVLDHRDAGFARGDVDQDLFAHCATGKDVAMPNPRNNCIVSCSGRPITPEKLPSRRVTKRSAPPWIAYAPARPIGSPLATYSVMSSSDRSANVTSVATSTDASRPADTSATAVSTWWLRPDRRRSIAAASAASAGLPTTVSSSTTSVSDPSTTAAGTATTRSSPAPAFSRATRAT